MFTIHSGLDSMRTFLNPHPHPFGMLTPGRSWVIGSGEGYWFGFNGQEQVDEVYGHASLNTAEFWSYEARLGRRWNVDIIQRAYLGSYTCFNNNPIFLVDPFGAVPVNPNKDGASGSGGGNKSPQSDGISGVLSMPSNAGPIGIIGSGFPRNGGLGGEDTEFSVIGQPGSKPVTPAENPDAAYSYPKIMQQSRFSEALVKEHFLNPFYCGSDNRASASSCNDLYKMLNRFTSKAGGTFSDYYSISYDMARHDKGIATVENIKKEFINQMKVYNGDYNKVFYNTPHSLDHEVHLLS